MVCWFFRYSRNVQSWPWVVLPSYLSASWFFYDLKKQERSKHCHETAEKGVILQQYKKQKESQRNSCVLRYSSVNNKYSSLYCISTSTVAQILLCPISSYLFAFESFHLVLVTFYSALLKSMYVYCLLVIVLTFYRISVVTYT